MQHDNKNTDKKLQELENQSLPDLSKMDTHWEMMRKVLEPEEEILVNKQRHFFKKLFSLFLIIGVCFLFLYLFLNTGELVSSESTASTKLIKADTAMPTMNDINSNKLKNKSRTIVASPEIAKSKIFVASKSVRIAKEEAMYSGKDEIVASDTAYTEKENITIATKPQTVEVRPIKMTRNYLGLTSDSVGTTINNSNAYGIIYFNPRTNQEFVITQYGTINNRKSVLVDDVNTIKPYTKFYIDSLHSLQFGKRDTAFVLSQDVHSTNFYDTQTIIISPSHLIKKKNE